MGRVRAPVSGGRSKLSPELKVVAAIAVVLVAVVGYWAFVKNKDDKQAEKTDGQKAPAAETAAAGAGGYALEVPAHGPAKAKAVLVKYTDFQ